jgi:hypothetical protein
MSVNEKLTKRSLFGRVLKSKKDNSTKRRVQEEVPNETDTPSSSSTPATESPMRATATTPTTEERVSRTVIPALREVPESAPSETEQENESDGLNGIHLWKLS